MNWMYFLLIKVTNILVDTADTIERNIKNIYGLSFKVFIINFVILYILDFNVT